MCRLRLRGRKTEDLNEDVGKVIMKREIAWHEDCLKNRENGLINARLSLERDCEMLRERIQNRTQQLQESEQEVKFLRLQIETAKAEGKKAFDCDKYLVKRKVKQDVPKPNGHRDDCVCDACLALQP
jgi:hypothetical protein